MRDMRDPQELGLKLLSRPQHIPIERMADLLDREYAQRVQEAENNVQQNGKPQGE